MATRKGKTIILDSKPRIIANAAIVGKKEGEGPLGNEFDEIKKDDENFTTKCPPRVIYDKLTQEKDKEIADIVEDKETLGDMLSAMSGLSVFSPLMENVFTPAIGMMGEMLGVPAKVKGWVCECGEILPEDLTCKCGRAYVQGEDGLVEK